MNYRRDLGRMGENWIDLWCSSAGLIANLSAVDKTGWDYYIEFPFLAERNVLQLHASAVECKVQVKATDGNKKAVAVPLTNMRRLITAQMPSFFVFLEFDGLENVQRAYVVHVDEAIIKDALARINEVIQSEGFERLNKRTLTIKYNDLHKIDQANGVCFKDSLLSHVNGGMRKYLDWKNRILATAGFGNVVGTIKFQTEGLDNLSNLVDASLGLVKSVEVKNILGRHKRFDVEDISPFINIESGHLEFVDLKPQFQGDLIFRNIQSSLNVIFKAELYSSSLVLALPKENQKFRVATQYFDLLFYPYVNKIDFKFKNISNEYFYLSEIRSFVEFLAVLNSGVGDLKWEFAVDEDKNISGNLNSEPEGGSAADVMLAFSEIDKILFFFNCRHDINVSLNGVVRNSENYKRFNALSANTTVLRITMPRGDKKLKSNEVVYFLGLYVLAIGDFYFYYLYSFHGAVKVSRKIYEVISAKVNPEWKYMCRKGGKIPKNEIDEVIKSFEKLTSDKYKLFTMFDYDEL